MMIPYIGEKSKYSNFIIPKIPTDISTYVEPFGGMFGIYFCLDLDQYPNTKFVYNDINHLNYNLFKYLTEETFLYHLQNIKVDENFYENAKSKLYDCSDPEKAVYWLIILTCSDSQVNVLEGKWKNDSEFEIFKIKIGLNRNYFRSIDSINNRDYKEIITKYDSTNSFFYIDPPYYNKELYYINHDFDNNDKHVELSEFLKGIKGRFALSYLYFSKLSEWYKGYNFYYFQTFMGKETLITNF